MNQALIKLLEPAYRVLKWQKPGHKKGDRLWKEDRTYEIGEIITVPIRTLHEFKRYNKIKGGLKDGKWVRIKKKNI
jgi:hypothetical protein